MIRLSKDKLPNIYLSTANIKPVEEHTVSEVVNHQMTSKTRIGKKTTYLVQREIPKILWSSITRLVYLRTAKDTYVYV